MWTHKIYKYKVIYIMLMLKFPNIYVSICCQILYEYLVHVDLTERRVFYQVSTLLLISILFTLWTNNWNDWYHTGSRIKKCMSLKFFWFIYKKICWILTRNLWLSQVEAPHRDWHANRLPLPTESVSMETLPEKLKTLVKALPYGHRQITLASPF